MRTKPNDDLSDTPLSRENGQQRRVYHWFYQDGRRVVQVSDQSNQRVAWANQLALGECSTAHRCLYQIDQQGSVLGSHDTLPHGIVYTPYGHRAAKPEAPAIGFVGQWLDRNIAGYHLGNGQRMYNPALNRFCSPDNLSPFDRGGLNAYAYCGNQPISRTDPSGHWWVKQEIVPLLQNKTSSLVTALQQNPELRLHAAGFSPDPYYNNGKQYTPSGFSRTRALMQKNSPQFKYPNEIKWDNKQIPNGRYYISKDNSTVLLGLNEGNDPTWVDAYNTLHPHDNTLKAHGYRVESINSYESGSMFQSSTGFSRFAVDAPPSYEDATREVSVIRRENN